MKVLVPVEDVFFGSAIIKFLTQHNWPEKVEFRIITVVEQFLLNDSEIVFSKFLTDTKQDAINSAVGLVEDLSRQLSNRFPNALVSHEVFMGHAREEILALSEYWPADLIVVGSHGKSGFNRLILGSISLALTYHAPCPVLLIKPNEKDLKSYETIIAKLYSRQPIKDVLIGKEDHIEKILVATDETKPSKQILDFISQHSWTQPAHFKILNVVKEPVWHQMLPPPLLEEMHQVLIQYGKDVASNLALQLRDKLHSPYIEEEVIRGDPKIAIIEAAKKWNADLIIVGCHQKNGLKQLLPGSVSLSVLCNAPCSVLLLREGKEVLPIEQEKTVISSAS